MNFTPNTHHLPVSRQIYKERIARDIGVRFSTEFVRLLGTILFGLVLAAICVTLSNHT